MRVLKIILLVFLLLLCLFLGALIYQYFSGETLLPGFLWLTAPAPPAVEPLPSLTLRPEGEREELLARAYREVWDYQLEGDCFCDAKEARQNLRITVLDAERLAGSGLREELLEALKERVSLARSAAEIYDEEGRFDPALVEEEYLRLLEERMERLADYSRQEELCLLYRRENRRWLLENGDALYPDLPRADELYAAATAELPYIPLRFPLPEDALKGSVPREEGYLITDDPAQVEALLARPEARALIGEQTPVWNPEIERIPGTSFSCYLDESILCIVWLEEEAGAVGTFAEVFISDGSQLRRKISSDRPWSLWFERTTEFARDTNAVLAFGGDFYYHQRSCGVCVYNREIIRFRPENADTCFITAGGDMLFLYRGAGVNQEEVEDFIRENDVVFSLAFGPVLIDGGEDVTPDYYPWGEVNEYYARSALGMLGERHYLTMNLNTDPHRPLYSHLPNLRETADAMLSRGCRKAYTLDGGQTASTAFRYQLVNPVQFGVEKSISDIIYFASSMPEE